MPSRPTVRAANGLVATGHHLATGAGLQTLREGGNAADAAVVAAFVCAVVMPHRTSIGGDLFALAHDAPARSVRAINGSGPAPARLDPGAFLDGIPERGPRVVTVPGMVAAAAALLERHGTWGLDRALRHAVAYAEDGFVVSAGLAAALAEHRDTLMADAGCATTFLPRGHVPRAGDILAQPDLARSLRGIASDGADAFYRGDLGERFAAEIERAGGWMASDDLGAHETEDREPLAIDYRGLRVYGQPPVSQGHVLLEELMIVAGDDLAALAWGSAELVHLMVEAKKHAFADRDAVAGDVAGFDAATLLDDGYARSRRERIGTRASEAPSTPERAGAHTTYLATIDRDGNAVSLIQSVFAEFGAAFIAPGTGILANDRLCGFSLDPESPNVLAPRKRPVHTLNTVLVTDGARPRFIFGTPGRHAQVQTNFQLAVALIDHGMDVQDAIEAPRWFHERGRRLGVESRFPEPVRKALASKGHQVDLLGDWNERTGGAQAIAVDPESGAFAGGADPRREGYAAGY